MSHRPAASLPHSTQGLALSKCSASKGFTIVEVMMAAAILVAGFMGMIQAITIGSEMMATARRQTLANQIVTHEIEKLRLKDWTYISSTLASSAASTYTSDSSALNTAISTSGVSFTLAVDVTSVTTELREVKFTVQWTKSGTSTAAVASTAPSWIDRLAFYRSAPIARTYTRVGVAYFGKYGLNLNIQRS